MAEYRKKLIETALPLEAINDACVEDKNRKTGHIRNIHKWFAPMPLPALRAIIASSLLNDPTSGDQDHGTRDELFGLLGSCVPLSASVDRRALTPIRELIESEWQGSPPTIVDPFCGGGSTLVEAQRLGLNSIGFDLNPLPVLITTLLTHVGPLVFGRRRVSHPNDGTAAELREGLTGFKDDVIYFAKLVRERAERDLCGLFPNVENGLKPIAYRWAWGVRSPAPGFVDAYVPLVSNWWLAKRLGHKSWVSPIVDVTKRSIEFRIETEGEPPERTSGGKGGFCLFSKTPIPLSYIRTEAKAGRLRAVMLAVAARDSTGVRFFEPTPEDLAAASCDPPADLPECPLPPKALGFRVQEYGFLSFTDLFTDRQKQVLVSFSRLVREVHEEILASATRAGYDATDSRPLTESGCGARAFADCVVGVLALCVGKLAQSNSTLVRWFIDPRNGSSKAHPAFDRHAVPMIWDFVETNPFGNATGDWLKNVSTALRAFDLVAENGPRPSVHQLDARRAADLVQSPVVVVTDPPYYANIGYADLSDYFYIWIRSAIGTAFPDLARTVLSPKSEELIASPHRHDGDKRAADDYFRMGFRDVFGKLIELQHPDVPMSIVYAFKQQESGRGSAETGWSTMLQGLVDAGVRITATWPMRTTRLTRMIGVGTNALASAIVVMCRRRSDDATAASRREFVDELRATLHSRLRDLQCSNIAPVDLAQAAIGQGMATFSRFSRVLNADGNQLRVTEALNIINEVLDEVLGGQESDFDADTRWAIKWFEQNGLADGEYGQAETLAVARNVSVEGVVESGIARSGAGKVRLLKRDELQAGWDPKKDKRLTIWEITQYLILRLEQDGETGAAELLRRVGAGHGETARELAYRLYQTCERKKWADQARSYNGLVVSWPEIERLSRERRAEPTAQRELFATEGE